MFKFLSFWFVARFASCWAARFGRASSKTTLWKMSGRGATERSCSELRAFLVFLESLPPDEQSAAKWRRLDEVAAEVRRLRHEFERCKSEGWQPFCKGDYIKQAVT